MPAEQEATPHACGQWIRLKMISVGFSPHF